MNCTSCLILFQQGETLPPTLDIVTVRTETLQSGAITTVALAVRYSMITLEKRFVEIALSKLEERARAKRIHALPSLLECGFEKLIATWLF